MQSTVVTKEVPGALPILGHVVPVLRSPLRFLRLAASHGDVVTVRLGRRRAYLVNDPVLLREVLNNSDRYARGANYEIAKEILHTSISTADGPYHRHQRRVMRPAFDHAHLAAYAEPMNRITTEQCRSWRDGQTVDMASHLLTLSIRIATESLFASSFDAMSIAEIQTGLPRLLKGLTLRAFDPTRLVGRLPLPVNRRYTKAITRMRAVVLRGIAEYRSHNKPQDDLVGMLLSACHPETGRPLTDDQITDEALGMLIGASETVSSTLAWTIHLLSTHPDVQRRVQEESDAVRAAGPLTTDRLTDLRYTRRVVSEAMRMFAPAALFTRTPTTDVLLGGHHIKAGALIAYSFYSLHRNPTLFSDADTFDPDRWLPGRAAQVTRPAFLPFSSGAHRCIGEHFAWTEALIVLSVLAGQWTVNPVAGHRIRPILTLTLRPRRLPITLRRR